MKKKFVPVHIVRTGKANDTEFWHWYHIFHFDFTFRQIVVTILCFNAVSLQNDFNQNSPTFRQQHTTNFSTIYCRNILDNISNGYFLIHVGMISSTRSQFLAMLLNLSKQ